MLNQNGLYAYAISESWYNDLKEDIHFENIYIYKEEQWSDRTAEVDVRPEELDKFEKLSREKGWM